jgi:hypothetical protein
VVERTDAESGAATTIDLTEEVTGNQAPTGPSVVGPEVREYLLPLRAARLALGPPLHNPQSLYVSAVLSAYRGGAVILGLLAVAVPVVGIRTSAFGIGWAYLSAACLGVLTVAVSAGGRVHSLLIRRRQVGGAGGPDDPGTAAGPATGPVPGQDLDARTIEDYFDVANLQARRAFRHSQFAMSAALGLLLVGGLAVVFAGEGPAQFVIGGLTAMGSGFAGFLGRTFLQVQFASVDQLNRAYAIPLAKNLLSYAHQIAQGASEPKVKDTLSTKIVESALKAVDSTMVGSLTQVRLPRSGASGSARGLTSRLGRGRAGEPTEPVGG